LCSTLFATRFSRTHPLLSADLSASFSRLSCLSDLDLQVLGTRRSSKMKFQSEGWVVGDKFWKKSHKCFYCDIVHPDRRREQRRLHEDANTADGMRAEIIAGVQRE